MNRTLDDIIAGQGQGGRAPRAGGASTSQRSQPYGRTGRGGRQQQQQQAAYNEEGDASRERISDSLDSTATPANAIKVAATQEAKEIAGRLIEGCRAGDAPALLTIGAASVNQAVKAIAIARAELLKEGISLTFQPAFRHTDRTKPLIAFYVAMQRTGRAGGDGGGEADVALTATAQGKVVPLAGAIAGKVRENLRPIVQAIGVDAVTNAVLAIGNARLYLEQDNCDIRVAPEFEKVEKNGTTLNALRLTLHSEQL